MEMENGKRIDAFYNPKERVILLFGYSRPQMEMEKGHGNYHFNSPLCLITSQPTDSGIFTVKVEGNSAYGFINEDTMRYKCHRTRTTF